MRLVFRRREGWINTWESSACGRHRYVKGGSRGGKSVSQSPAKETEAKSQRGRRTPRRVQSQEAVTSRSSLKFTANPKEKN